MDHPLRQPLRPLRERVRVGQVEVADEIDDAGSSAKNAEQHRGRARNAPAPRRDGERKRGRASPARRRATTVPANVPVHLLERDAEDAREEEEARDAPHASRSSSCASSSTRVRRETCVAPLVRERRPSSAPVAPARVQVAQRGRDALDVVGRDDDAGARLADQLGGGAVGRHDGEDRPLGREVLEHLAAEHALAAAARLRDQEQQHLRVALQLERAPARRVRDQLEPVAEAELLGPLAVGRAEVAEEARDDVVEPDCCKRGQERPRVALAEERARVRDAERARDGVCSSPAKSSKSEPFAIVTTSPFGVALAHLVGDRLGDARRSRPRAARRASRPRARPAPSRARAAARRGGADARRPSRAGRRPTARRSRA